MNSIIPCPNCYSENHVTVIKKPAGLRDFAYTCGCQKCGFSGQAALCEFGEDPYRAVVLSRTSYNTSASKAHRLKRGLL